MTRMKPTDYLALSIGTCGVGYLPLAPGTFGSLVGVGIFWLLVRVNPLVIVVAILAVTFAGIWAGSRVEQVSGRKDPGKVVLSFILFRFFDIVKPFPANRLQDLDGGMGIMFDDLVAGVYGAVVVSILCFIH